MADARREAMVDAGLDRPNLWRTPMHSNRQSDNIGADAAVGTMYPVTARLAYAYRRLAIAMLGLDVKTLTSELRARRLGRRADAPRQQAA
jgi:hypothetical protein